MGGGPEWAALLTARRADRDEKVAATAPARARAPVATATLREAWEHTTTAERREVMTLRFDCIALRRRDDRALELVIFPAGSGPAGLTRRGFKRAPVLKAIDVPADARVVPL
jgi:hypothetical protein